MNILKTEGPTSNNSRMMTIIYRWMYLLGALFEPGWGIYQKYYSSIPTNEIIEARFIVSAIILFGGISTFFEKFQEKYFRIITVVIMVSFNIQRAYLLYHNQSNWNYIFDCYTVVILSVIVAPTMKDLIWVLTLVLIGSAFFPAYDYTLFFNNVFIIPLVSTLKIAQFHSVAQMQKMQQQMKEQSVLAGAKELVGTISHDLNNNLQKIDNLATLGQYKDQQSDVNQCFLKIQDEVQRTSQVLSSFKSLIDAGEVQKKITNSNVLISELLLIFKDKVSNYGIQLSITKEDHQLNCDKKFIQNMMIHIIKNALDELKKPEIKSKIIKIIVSEDDLNSYIRIANNGNKIPDAIKEKIFTPFFSTKEKGEGFGLGLSSVKDLILRHGGDVTLEESGDFTVFCIKIPK